MWGHMKAFHSDVVGQRTFLLKRKRRVRHNGVLVDPEEDDNANAIAAAAVETLEGPADDLGVLSPSALSDSSPGKTVSSSDFLLSLTADSSEVSAENSEGQNDDDRQAVSLAKSVQKWGSGFQ